MTPKDLVRLRRRLRRLIPWLAARGLVRGSGPAPRRPALRWDTNSESITETRLTLAHAYALTGSPDLARRELATARRMEPRYPRLPHVERLLSYPQGSSLSTD